MGGGPVHYQSVVFDSARWEGFAFREGDIVVSTPPKCGTTWTQALCAFLVHGTELPGSLSHVSPWLDMLTSDIDEIRARLDAQDHRRVIKTHTPLDGLPFDERATYVGVGRDPRDVHLSWEHHVANTNVEALFAARMAAVGLDDLEGMELPERPEDDRARFWQYVEEPPDPISFVRLQTVLHHLHTFWVRRDEPNVALFHYADLQRDLPGEVRRLASVVGIERSDAELDEIARAASFSEMRGKAADYVPDVSHGIWLDNESFFHRGATGQWRDLIDAGEEERYERRVRELVGDDLARWAHGGWAAVPDLR